MADFGSQKAPRNDSVTVANARHLADVPWQKEKGSDPYGTRTRVAAVKGRSPRPLDEGAAALT